MIILVDLDIQTIIEIVGLIISILTYVENRKKQKLPSVSTTVGSF